MSTSLLHVQAPPPPGRQGRCLVVPLGCVDYLAAWDLQKELVQRRAQGEIPDLLVLLEHPHVYTIGRRGSRGDVLTSPEELERLGIPVYEVDRGGEVTYHGPGQLVGYPIIGLRGLGPLRYVRALESALIDALGEHGLPAYAVPGRTGVWVGEQGEERKIAAIGLRVSRGVASHGFALNVSTDLRYFDGIVPCGVDDRQATSIERETGNRVDITDVQGVVARAFAERLGLVIEEGPQALSELRALLAAGAVSTS